ncbi:DedA family protein [Candidatus Woesearchaeota archaeon]|nr:DedA family protein [Candidatus Woesearchaeota archaeon]
MSVITDFFSFVMQIDKHLLWLINQFGAFSYAIIFFIIFLETGLVFTPFLPGDSLLFASGALAAVGAFNVFLLLILLSFAAVLGDSVNYAIGHFIGKKILERHSGLIKKEYVDRTKKFYDKYGGKTIIIARFIPIIRTFAPFLAGIGTMQYWKFLAYNVIGGILWVAFFLFAGYFFGTIPFVKEHFTLAIIIIIVVSLIPAMIEFVKYLREKKKLKPRKS